MFVQTTFENIKNELVAGGGRIINTLTVSGQKLYVFDLESVKHIVSKQSFVANNNGKLIYTNKMKF